MGVQTLRIFCGELTPELRFANAAGADADWKQLSGKAK